MQNINQLYIDWCPLDIDEFCCNLNWLVVVIEFRDLVRPANGCTLLTSVRDWIVYNDITWHDGRWWVTDNVHGAGIARRW